MYNQRHKSPAGVYGDDWPAWRRNLFPVTYERDPAVVASKTASCWANLAQARRLLASAMKRGERHSVASLRRDADRYQRHVRNCETQARLIREQQS